MAEGGYEEIPMEERGHDNDGFDDDEEEQGTLFRGGGNVMYGSISREMERGARPMTRDETVTYENPTYEAGGGLGLDDSIFVHRDERQDEAKRRIQKKYPNWDPKKSSFVATINDKGQVTASLIKGRKIDSKPYVLFKKDGTLRKGLLDKIVEDLGKDVAETFKEVDERKSLVDELRRENEGLLKRIGEEVTIRRRTRVEMTRLRENIERREARISIIRNTIGRTNEEKKRLKEEGDKELKKAEENHKAEVERLKNNYEISIKELGESHNRNISDSNRNYEERIGGIIDKHGREFEQAKENYEAEIEKLKDDYEAQGKELDKFYKDKINSLKENNVGRLRKIADDFEKVMKQKDKQLSNYEEELGRTQSLLKDSREEVARIKRGNKTLSAKDQKILEENEMRVEENEERIDELTRENEATLERISLKERVKHIFKKYGVTAFGIITAVGTVIGVVVSNLKSGLAKVAKGVGNGLKELGKKLAQLLPGMIGAIAKYIFNTAGEVVGYLAKNTWLLIVAAVVYAVEQFKKKNK